QTSQAGAPISKSVRGLRGSMGGHPFGILPSCLKTRQLAVLHASSLDKWGIDFVSGIYERVALDSDATRTQCLSGTNHNHGRQNPTIGRSAQGPMLSTSGRRAGGEARVGRPGFGEFFRSS